ncbi:MAG: zf-HC2 domain-containing protein [Acidobacteria bacterium]|nr:zf-HC2 domain-containing protein [Acidobacteriota bacterium]
MSGCTENARQVHRYLDGELPDTEALAFEHHLMDRGHCQARYQNLRAVADLVRGAKPLYDVPESSLAGARALVAGHEHARRWNWRLRAAAAILVILGAGGLGSLLARRAAAAHFPEFAVKAHRRYSTADMPLAIVSSRPDLVSAWLRRRVGFPLQLPEYPVIAGASKAYRLVGAGLLPFGGSDVAFVAYEMDHKPISLLMASTSQAASSGGSLYRSGGLLFRFFEAGSLHVIAWTDHNIHYCLVSELGARGAESCLICHGSATVAMFRSYSPENGTMPRCPDSLCPPAEHFLHAPWPPSRSPPLLPVPAPGPPTTGFASALSVAAAWAAVIWPVSCAIPRSIAPCCATSTMPALPRPFRSLRRRAASAPTP